MARIPENTGHLYQFKIEMVKPGLTKQLFPNIKKDEPLC